MLGGGGTFQAMMEQQTAQFYQQYMQQYQAMVMAYDARLGEEQPAGDASSSAGAPAPAPACSESAGGAGAIHMPLPAEEPVKPQSKEEITIEIGEIEELLKETETRAKRAATLSKHFVGIIDRFDTKKGHGFVACPETYAKYQQDIFIDRESFTGARVGDTVVFSLGFNKKGAVRACDVRKLKEVSRLKELLDTMNHQLRGTTPSVWSQLNGGKADGKKGSTIFAKKATAGWEKQAQEHNPHYGKRNYEGNDSMIYNDRKRQR